MLQTGLELILPVVNMNGTSREELIEQRRHQLDWLRAALGAFRNAVPHARDWQTDPQRGYTKAREIHARRVTLLNKIKNEIEEEAFLLSKES